MSRTDVPRLAERYGTPSAGRRRALLVAVVAVVAVGLGWLAWTTWVHSTPSVTSELVTFEVVDDGTATGVLEVSLDDDLSPADAADVTCTVRALAEDKSVVGQTSLVPEDGAQTVTVRTERRATSVESLGCTAPGQNRPR